MRYISIVVTFRQERSVWRKVLKLKWLLNSLGADLAERTGKGEIFTPSEQWLDNHMSTKALSDANCEGTGSRFVASYGL